MGWLRRVGLSGLLLALSGVVSVALGVALFFVPEVGMAALTWLRAMDRCPHKKPFSR